ncbi:BURP domain-containing protein BNM2A-like isoform X2 [Primulina eburnea]|uniref:BURP domain-containing protein BNM2A-like isoform X2 n=1 Tax=Primulina eburnea TaxID=1245227 RepID=UPI003C6C9B42
MTTASQCAHWIVESPTSMDVKLLTHTGLLLHLLILLGSYVNGQILGNHGNDHFHADMRIELVHDSHDDESPSHMHHNMHPSLIVFFFVEDLKLGNTIPVYFPRKEPSSSPNLLPKEEADSIPFGSQELPNLLQFFSFPQDSSQATAMQNTLRACEAHPIKGETKICATSLESMLDFVQTIFGLETKLKVISTTHYTETKTPIQQKYTVKGIREVSAPKFVACHTIVYPYAVFYCHHQTSKSRVFVVSLTGENGDKVEALAVCHLDTTQWSKNHVSFKVLGIKPGSSPVCHFFPADNFVWVPSDDSMV